MRMLVALFALLLSAPSLARTVTEAPTFKVLGGDKVDTLPLELTRVDATLVGAIADVTVTQRYENLGTKTIEAVYVFPASERAAVYALTMKIGDRVVRARIQEKNKARETYEAAKETGRTATLLEASDVDVFQMSLANIRPGDSIDVELKYTEKLVPNAGVYEFFYPNTVGTERYQGAAADRTPKELKGSNDPAVSAFNFEMRARILAPVPVRAVESPSHRIDVERKSANETEVKLSELETYAGAKDFRLRYALRGDAVQNGVLLFPGADESFFLLTLQPPARVDLSIVPPREFIFVVDVSGSMAGMPLATAKSLMSEMLLALRPEDRFDVIQFAGGAGVLYPKGSVAASDARVREAQNYLDHAVAGGGTELLPALETAYALPRDPQVARSIVIVTDGGIAAGLDASQLIRSHLDEANVFVFGAGAYAEHTVIRRLARAGRGEAAVVTKAEQAQDATVAFRGQVEHPLLTGIHVAFEGFEAYDVQPAVAADLLAERPLVIVGKYRGAPAGRIVVTGRQGAKPYRAAIDVFATKPDPRLSVLRALWARDRLDELYDDRTASFNDAAYDKPITELGLKYSLLTPYTSFVAVSNEVRGPSGDTTVEQPVAKRSAIETSGSGHGAITAPATVTGENYAGGLRHRAKRPAADAVRETTTRTEMMTQSTTSAPPPPKVALNEPLPTPAAPPAPAAPPVSAGPVEAQVGARHFKLVDGVWTDEGAAEAETTLRIKRGTPAYRDLLKLRPELKEALELGDTVLIGFGKYAILVGPEGFSTYSHAVLRKAVGANR